MAPELKFPQRIRDTLADFEGRSPDLVECISWCIPPPSIPRLEFSNVVRVPPFEDSQDSAHDQYIWAAYSATRVWGTNITNVDQVGFALVVVDKVPE